MFTNNPYDLVAPAMLAELHRAVTSKETEEAPVETQNPAHSIVQAIASHLNSLKLPVMQPDPDCAEC